MIELIHGDCFEHLKTIEDGSVDCGLFDPPYFSTKLHFDNKKNRFDFKVLLLELKRILKPNGVLVIFADFNLLAELRSYNLVSNPLSPKWKELNPLKTLKKHVLKTYHCFDKGFL